MSFADFYPSIIHVDADAFFASCEQAIHPEYRGKPVITGKERGIVAAASYEAKKFGVKRGVPLRDVIKMCPGAIIVPSDYETYSLFSKRMFEIIRRFTPVVEEYSIDEAFADISGLRRPLNMSYKDIAFKIKQEIDKSLGITVSVGLSLNKVLAKVGSKWDKPSGFTVISHSTIPDYLQKLPAGDVWGIGPNTAAFLNKHGIKSAYDFVKKSESWVQYNLSKPQLEIYLELKGKKIYSINEDNYSAPCSISKTKTFTPPSRDKFFVYAQLIKNLENAFIKCRRHHLAAKKIVILLKKHDFNGHFKTFGMEGIFNRPTCFPSEAAKIVRVLFDKMFKSAFLYRATGIILSDLTEDSAIQMDLFENPLQINKMQSLYGCMDKLASRFGKHTVFIGSSFPAHSSLAHKTYRGELPITQQLRKNNVNKRKFLSIPLLFQLFI